MTALSGVAMAQSVNLTMLVDNASHTLAISEALAEAFEAKNPDVSIDIEARPGGGEGDNIVKTRLATGQMTDIFWYNTGSLMQALAPERTLVDLSDEPFMDNVADSFKQVVTAGEGVYAVPTRPAEAGGIFYNRKIYEELGLEVPRSWDEFMANNEKIKAAGKTAVIQTYGEPWTSQVLVLADFYNVQSEVPDFAEKYTAGEAKFATTPAALRGFERLKAVADGGYFNADFGAATYEDGLRMLAEGEGAHYPMISFAIPALSDGYPELMDDVGFFAQPGDSAEDNGLTVWMPAGFYIPQSSPNIEVAKEFLAFVASPEGCEAQSQAVAVNGPYLIDGCTLPDDVAAPVADLLPYFQEGGKNAPALEFLSPIKGPILEQLTVEVGSGFREPADAAALYDEDVRKQAQQLGLSGW
ncbi:ABC transporter substrate-binding protein [Devosia albogilva]|uniref:ABC transporter substrate-binding protein n=1 Tax=Devosia albogilva TaxID=429726 RepID=A0ABW5QHG4_9HYPH